MPFPVFPFLRHFPLESSGMGVKTLPKFCFSSSWVGFGALEHQHNVTPPPPGQPQHPALPTLKSRKISPFSPFKQTKGTESLCLFPKLPCGATRLHAWERREKGKNEGIAPRSPGQVTKHPAQNLPWESHALPEFPTSSSRPGIFKNQRGNPKTLHEIGAHPQCNSPGTALEGPS